MLKKHIIFFVLLLINCYKSSYSSPKKDEEKLKNLSNKVINYFFKDKIPFSSFDRNLLTKENEIKVWDEIFYENSSLGPGHTRIFVYNNYHQAGFKIMDNLTAQIYVILDLFRVYNFQNDRYEDVTQEFTNKKLKLFIECVKIKEEWKIDTLPIFGLIKKERFLEDLKDKEKVKKFGLIKI